MPGAGEEMNWELIILNAAILTGIGIIGYFLRDMRTTVKEKFKEHDEKIDCIEGKYHDLREDLPQRFVMRDDYIRALSGFGNKLEKIYEAVSGLGERMASQERK